MEVIHYLTALILGILVIAIGYGAYSSVTQQTNESIQESIDDALETKHDFSLSSSKSSVSYKNEMEVCIECRPKIEKEYHRLPRL